MPSNILCTTDLKINVLLIFSEESVIFTKPLTDVQISESQDVDFECTVSRPGLTAEWTKDGVELIATDRIKPKSVDTTHTLHIANVEIDDAAVYEVKVGDATSKSTLVVEGMQAYTFSGPGCSKHR